MIAVTAAAAFALNDVVDRRVFQDVVMFEAGRLGNIVNHLPLDKNATIKFSYNGSPHKDPQTGETTREHRVELDYGDWRDRIEPALGGAAYFKGFKLMVPRLIIALFGFAAFAALAAYFIALTVRSPQLWARILGCGFGASLFALALFTVLTTEFDLTFASAFLVFVPGLVLVFACLRAVDLDHRAGLSGDARLLGASFALPAGSSPPPLQFRP